MKKTIFSLTIALLTLASCSSTESDPIEIPTVGATLNPEVGGPNQPNQVYLDLSTGKSEVVNRETWDFGFATGTDFRVIINGSLKMAVKKLETSDITAPQEIDTKITVGQGDVASTTGYVDNPTGVLTGNGQGIGTAIAEVSANDADNKVYLVNMGFAVSTEKPAKGAVNVYGAARGWKKVRVLRNANGYKIQYADLASTTFQERTIAKDDNFNFTFFSIKAEKTVTVEPLKSKWDLNFTTFTNYVNFGSEVLYGYSDFVISNRKGGTQVYEVLVADQITYEGFVLSNVDPSKFEISKTDQRIIGGNWRSGGGPSSLPSIKTDRFYIVKDEANNNYKVKFLTMTNDAGERGNPVLEYALLK